MRSAGVMLWAAVSLALVGAGARADVPNLMNYQGRLTDGGGRPVTGVRQMTFRFYDAPTHGNPLPVAAPFAETQQVAVTDGIFNVLIGSATVGGVLPGIFYQPNVYLSVTVEGEQLEPRQQIVTVGFAFKARRADHAQHVGPEVVLGSAAGAGRLAVVDTDDEVGFDVDGHNREIRRNWAVKGTFPAPAFDSGWVQPPAVVWQWDGFMWEGTRPGWEIVHGLGGDLSTYVAEVAYSYRQWGYTGSPGRNWYDRLDAVSLDFGAWEDLSWCDDVPPNDRIWYRLRIWVYSE